MKHTLKRIWLTLTLVFTGLHAEPGWVFFPGIEEEIVQPPVLASTTTEASSAVTVPEGDEITDEIAALARGLQYDPVAIYNYVRNEIDHMLYYGLRKGAALCLIEKSGNDLDQCALLAALLKASGYSPVYHYGTMTIPLNAADDMDMLSWLPATSSNGVKNMLKWTGNPNFNPSDSNFTPIRVWIEVTIDGTTYLLDPAYKHYETLPALADVLTEAGYKMDDYVTDAAGDKTLSGVDPAFYTENLDVSAIHTRLRQDTESLLTGMANHYPNHSPKEIIGGRSLIREDIADISSLPQVLPFASNTTETWNYGELPETYATKINFNITNRMDLTLYTAELQGKRLALTLHSSTGSTGNRAALWLDDTKIAEESSESGSSATMKISITHPSPTFTLANQNDGGKAYRRGANYAIIYAFDANAGLMNHRQRKLEAYRASGLENDSREVLTETLNIIGQQWLYQTDLFLRITATIDPNLLYLNYHRFGRMGQEEGFYIDVSLQTFVTMNRTGSFLPGNPAIYAGSYFHSAMEHGVLQQTQGAENGSVSTIKMIETANYNNGNPQGRVFYADRDNFQTGDNIRSKLTGYPSSTLDSLNATLNQNASNFVLLPQKGNFVESDWTGTGYMQIKGNSIKMVISGNYFGGYSTNYGTISTPSVYNRNIASPTYYSYNPPSLVNPKSLDPVDMATGAFLLDSTDLSLGRGNAPRGLSFTRSYNSQRRADDSSDLGFGWTHNWKGSVTIRSAVDAGLGETTAAEAAPLMLAAAAVRDLIANRDSRNARNWVIAALITDWATDQLLDNAASVTIGKRTLQFIRMPDGSFVAPAGVSSTLVEEPGGDFVLSERFGNRYRFDGDNDHRLENITDIYGKVLKLEYKGDGKLDYIEDADSRRLTFTYTNDRISGITDSTNRMVSFAYDGEGNLISYTDANNDSTEYHYHDTNTGVRFAEEHCIVAIENGKDELSIRNFYDTQFRVTKQHGDDDSAREYQLFFNGVRNVEMDPLGGETSYFFSPDYRDLGSANPLGQRTAKSYDGQDHIIKTLTPGGADIDVDYDANHNLTSRSVPGNLRAVYAYDSLHRPTEQRIQDLSGAEADRVTTYSYDASNTTNLVNSLVDPEGNETRFTYYPDGQVHTRTRVSASGNRTSTYSYDALGMPQRIDYPDGTSEHFVYNARGDLSAQTNRRGKTTSYQYNARRQLTQTTHPDAGTVINTYDAAGNLETVTDPEGTVTRYTYSPQKKLLSVTTADGTAEAATTSHEYDARDWRVRTIDPLGHITAYEHDAAGRVIKVIDPLGRATTFTYDADGNRNSVTTPAGITTEFEYNERGERTTLTDPADKTINYTHNAFGEQTALNNRRSQTYRFTFDNNGSPLTLVTPLGNTTTRTYNDLSQVETVEEASGQSTSFVYDAAGRVERLTDPVGTITTTYDAGGNPLTLSEGSAVLSRTFDDMDRVVRYTDAAGHEIEYSYFKNGLLKSLTYPDNKTVHYAYDPNNRLQTVTDWSGRVTTYTRDAAGRLTGINRPNGTRRANQYTDANELDRFYEYAPHQSALHAYHRFAYDADSRIDWRYRLPEPQAFDLPDFDASYDSDNRLATWNSLAVSHDADGNMTTGPLPGVAAFVSYSYDARNRLTGVNGTSYAYDPAGNRVSVTDTSGTTRYTLDPHGAALPRVLVRTRPDGSVTRYVYGIGLLYEVDESDAPTYYHYDQSGSTIALTDAGGAVTDRIEYSPYGTITHRTGTSDTPFLYAGQFGIMTDANGLLHMRARYYSPELRRFINADPIGFAGGLNWYQYAAGNPISLVDPQGTNPLLIWAAVALRFGATRAYTYAAPIVTSAAVRSGQAITRGAQAAARVAQQTYNRASQAVSAGVDRVNLAVAQAQQSASSPAALQIITRGLGAATALGAANQAFDGPIDTSGLAGVDFGPTPIGATIDRGLQAFNGAGASVGIIRSGINAAVPAAQNFIGELRETFGTPTFTDGLGSDPFSGVNFDGFGSRFNRSYSSGLK